MAPLRQAINPQYAYTTEGKDGKVVYRGDVDPEWCIYKIPHGGYVLALVLEAVVKNQAGSSHPDPIHVTAHFIKSTSVGPFEVHIRIVKRGKGFINLAANLVQRDEDIVLTHVICGTLKPEDLTRPAGTTIENMTIAPPSSFAVQIPVFTHPSKCKKYPSLSRWTFKERIVAARDPVYEERMRAARGIGGSDWAQYMSLAGEDECLTQPMLAFFADSHLPFPVLLPALTAQESWLPTMVMTLEFKFPLPQPGNTECSQRTVTVYSRGKFVNDPSARHDTYVEVWTAPGNIGEGSEGEAWKVKQRCLAVCTQMALVVPADVNRRRAQSAVGSKL